MSFLLLLIVGYASFYSLLGMGYTLEFAQGAVVGAVLLAFLTRKGRRLIPVPITLLASLLVVTVFSSASLRMQNVVLLAPSASDRYGVRQRELRHTLEDGRVSVAVSSYERVPENQAELLRAVQHRRNVGFGIFEDGNWLRVLLRPSPDVTLGSVSPWLAVTSFSELKIIRDVGGFSLSREPRDQTGEFLATLASALSSASPQAEELLVASAGIVAPWRGASHRAYPLWVAATNRMVQFAEGSDAPAAALRCSIAEYERALRYVRAFEHPSLRAAIVNNLVVAQLIQRELRVRPQRRGLRRLLRLAKDALRLARGPLRGRVLEGVRAGIEKNAAILSPMRHSSHLRGKKRKLRSLEKLKANGARKGKRRKQ